MAGQDGPLNESVSGTFNTAGVLELFVAPPALETWTVQTVALLTNDPITGTQFPLAKVYQDSVADGNFIAGTYSGNLDSATCNIELGRNQRLIVRWEGGISGRRGTLSINGRREY